MEAVTVRLVAGRATLLRLHRAAATEQGAVHPETAEDLEESRKLSEVADRQSFQPEQNLPVPPDQFSPRLAPKALARLSPHRQGRLLARTHKAQLVTRLYLHSAYSPPRLLPQWRSQTRSAGRPTGGRTPTVSSLLPPQAHLLPPRQRVQQLVDLPLEAQERRVLVQAHQTPTELTDPRPLLLLPIMDWRRARSRQLSWSVPYSASSLLPLYYADVQSTDASDAVGTGSLGDNPTYMATPPSAVLGTSPTMPIVARPTWPSVAASMPCSMHPGRYSVIV